MIGPRIAGSPIINRDVYKSGAPVSDPARSADFQSAVPPTSQSAGVSNYRPRAHLDPWQTGSLRNSRLGSLRYDRQPALPALREPFAEISIYDFQRASRNHK